MQAFPQFTVVDSRLQAGRGEDFSASRQKEKEQITHAQQSYDDAEPWHLPIGHRPQDSLDTEGLAMASTDTAIPEHNRGFQMLQKMGWKGTGLGRNEDGIQEPVRGGVEAGLRLGVGKAEQDTFYMAADNVVRKKLEVELQADEDQGRRDRREMQAERDERIRQDVTIMQRPFFCQTCSKQYKNAAEMEAHMSSYDHHHKKRLIEMRVDEAERTRGVRDKKEKKRADKEMARLQAQIQAAQAAAAPASASASTLAAATAAPQPPNEDPPPLPPLPFDEQDPPPPPPADISDLPPLPPSAVPLPPAQYGSQSCARDAPGSSHGSLPQDQWAKPVTASNPAGWQGRTGTLSAPMGQTRAGYSTTSHVAVSRPDQQGRQQPSGVHVKSEPGTDCTASRGMQPEGTSTTGRTAAESDQQVKVEAQPTGAIQFGFGNHGKVMHASKAPKSLRSAAGSKRLGLAARPTLAAFGNVDSDDDAP